MKSHVPLTTLSLLLAFTFVSSGCNSSTASSKMSGEPKMGMDDKMGTAKMSSDKMEAEKMGADSTIKYGYKCLKRLSVIDLTSIRPPDYWANRGYDWSGGH